jgi:hypothetical protein
MISDKLLSATLYSASRASFNTRGPEGSLLPAPLSPYDLERLIQQRVV